MLECVEKHGGAGTEKLRGLARNDGAVLQLQRNGRCVGQFCFFQRRENGGTRFLVNTELIHDELDLLNLALFARALSDVAKRGVIAADDFLTGSFVGGFVVENTIADHVNAHIRGALIRRRTVNFFKHDLEDRENGNVSVIVDSGNAVCFKVIGVDHVNVAHVRGCRFVCEVDGMAEREIPDGEGFKFRIAGTDSALMLVIKLGEAGCHLTASGPRSRDDDELTRGFNIFVFAESLFADDVRDIGRIIFNGIVTVNLDSE